ncbi:TetR/AcrR family transcriptional regulator [Thermomonospora umbrina]|uniref:TetR family transcriptional regulator n=1 Tax=Thermomonospora umbrina TaxID=111806 RepID=A0A3D9SZK7_9ACTN|nr:TetR/AcrR family transcriptional regulator [Thermomonospora umbrina]REE98425.1 TetR family transcriptional regulator [Thermomonospora umbrina]
MAEARTRRRLSPAERRAELIDAAVRVLREQGEPVNRAAAVTAAAGAAKATFYVYFPSWEDMLAAVRDRVMDDYSAPLRERLADDAPGDWWAVLDGEIDRFVDFTLGLGGLHRAVFYSSTELTPIDEERSATTLVARMIRRGVAEGSVRDVDPDTSADLFFAALHAAADAIAQGGDRDRWCSGLRDLTRRWLAPETSRPQGPARQ